MDESDFQDHVIQLRDAKKPRNATKLAKKKKVVEMVAHKTAVEKAQAKAIAKAMDDNIVNEVIIDFTNTSIMDKDPEVSNVVKVDEVMHPSQQKESASKQLETSHEATPNEKDVPDVVIIYSTSLSHTPINYAPPNIVTKGQVQEMTGQAMDTFVERQRQENEKLRLYAKHYQHSAHQSWCCIDLELATNSMYDNKDINS